MSRGLAGFGRSRCALCRQRAQSVDRFEVRKNHGGGDAATLPVVDSLLNSRAQLEAKQPREGAIAASGFDDFPGVMRVHAVIKHHV